VLSKLEFYGISGKPNSFIKSYLQNRYQRVLIDCDSKQFHSKWETVPDGVPQGSILEPLLFLLYVNDLANAISEISNPVLYADDTSLIITNTDSQMFEMDTHTVILQLNRWCNSSLLILNLEKTYYRGKNILYTTSD
jgi:hypothetical protein